jgi:iron complex outermembrane receptor protein
MNIGTPLEEPVISALRARSYAVARARAIAGTLLLASSTLAPVQAQHATDNPVATATDAFGLTLGLETIGLYGPNFVRGFSPQTAGNVRIEGLYFDQQGALSKRVVDGSTIRIGVSEVGYAFPAPTGIVDYRLRSPGDGTPSATIVASAGPFQARGASIDGNLPLISGELRLPMGASYQINTQGSGNPGYTSKVLNFGTTPQWKPNDRLTFRGIFDWTKTTQAKTLPIIVTGGDYQPPRVPRGYYGQDWAEGHKLSENYGGIVAAQLSTHWSLAAGIFRSVADNQISFADLYLDTQPDGTADHVIVSNPDQVSASNSGEARLVGHFGTGSWHHNIVLLARGRDTLARYGGSDVVDLGPALIDGGLQAPEPAFTYGARTNDRTKVWGAGLAYRAQWQRGADLAIGIQQQSYTKDVIAPGLPAAHLTDRPLRAYATAALALTEKATAYAGYTQGLEDSGVASSSANNRGAILPDARTWQTDAGIRYLLTPEVNLIAGFFEIQKPYFNLDSLEVDRALGLQRASGLELSLSGEVVRNLNVTLATMWGQVKVLGANLRAEGIGSVALSQSRVTATLDANYSLPWLPALSIDTSILTYGPYPVSVDDRARASPGTLVALGSRYRFKVLGAPTTLRVQVQNLTNIYFWNLGFNSPEFTQYHPRAYFGYLTMDL